MEPSAILKLENPSDKPMRVWFEPWGDFRDLQPGQQFDLEFHASVPGEPEVKRIEEGFVVCAWPSATLTAKSAGSEVVNFILPVPDVPSGMKCRLSLSICSARLPMKVKPTPPLEPIARLRDGRFIS
jgi:hypothetical protein